MLAALALPMLLVASAAAVDYGLATRDQVVMQAAADASALAAAREMANGHLTPARLSDVVQGFAIDKLEGQDLTEGNQVSARILGGNRSVEVVIRRPMRSMFPGLLPGSKGGIEVDATATVVGNQKVCVVALDEASAQTVHMKSNS